ncbi:hypothetical protein JCM10908_005559 [Rhodotorula pacifica]|uniref:uncharacterized protein n=1 Tax=Rhodotorula pacifica TaxID=1495444 RepID=UPI003179B127
MAHIGNRPNIPAYVAAIRQYLSGPIDGHGVGYFDRSQHREQFERVWTELAPRLTEWARSVKTNDRHRIKRRAEHFWPARAFEHSASPPTHCIPKLKQVDPPQPTPEVEPLRPSPEVEPLQPSRELDQNQVELLLSLAAHLNSSPQLEKRRKDLLAWLEGLGKPHSNPPSFAGLMYDLQECLRSGEVPMPAQLIALDEETAENPFHHEVAMSEHALHHGSPSHAFHEAPDSPHQSAASHAAPYETDPHDFDLIDYDGLQAGQASEAGLEA